MTDWKFYRNGEFVPITEDEARHTFDRWGVLSDDRGMACLMHDQLWAEIDRLRAELAAKSERIAELESAATTWREDACRLSGGLIAIRNAAPTVPASVLRGSAYDIALNCIDPETAEFQIEARAAKATSDGDPP